MEKVTNEDGFNVVVTKCDHCGAEIANLGEAQQQWYTVDIKPLVRDEWAEDFEENQLHFCSEPCFHTGLSDFNPSEQFDSFVED